VFKLFDRPPELAQSWNQLIYKPVDHEQKNEEPNKPYCPENFRNAEVRHSLNLVAKIGNVNAHANGYAARVKEI
jgi:hypothetical protein